jgi:peptide/nickel transport system permease protein
MRLLRYSLRRAGQAVVVLLLVVVLQFLLLHLAPGDVADVIAGEAQASDPAFIEQLRRELGLDQPVALQLWLHLQRVITLDWGHAHSMDAPVWQLIAERLPGTALLMVSALGLAIVLGVLLGMLAAMHARRWLDGLISVLALLFYATPGFLVGIGLILLFSVQLQWLPMSGMSSLYDDSSWWLRGLDLARHLVLPMLSLALFYVAIYTRLMRAAMLEVLPMDYVRTARSKGLSRWRVAWHHAARNALLPIVTMAGLQVSSLLGGSVIVETIFGWPGIGRLAFEAVFKRDVPLVMGILLLSSVLVLLTSLLVDLVYTRLDPRIRLGRAHDEASVQAPCGLVDFCGGCGPAAAHWGHGLAGPLAVPAGAVVGGGHAHDLARRRLESAAGHRCAGPRHSGRFAARCAHLAAHRRGGHAGGLVRGHCSGHADRLPWRLGR